MASAINTPDLYTDEDKNRQLTIKESWREQSSDVFSRVAIRSVR